MTTPTHTLIVTYDEADDVYYYDIAPHDVTDHCRMWRECVGADCDREPLDAAADDGDDEPTAHGVAHRYVNIEGGMSWAKRTGSCWLRESDWLDDVAAELKLPAGRHEVVHAYVVYGGDESSFRLDMVRTEVAA